MIAQEPRHGTTEVEHIDVDANQHVYMTFLGGRTGWELQRAVIIHAIIYVSNARIGELPVPRSASQRGVCEESMMTLSVPAAIL